MNHLESYATVVKSLISLANELINQENPTHKDLEEASSLLKQASRHRRHMNTLELEKQAQPEKTSSPDIH